MTKSSDASFLTGTNIAYIAELFDRYLDDPTSVDASWQDFFADMKPDAAVFSAGRQGPSWARQAPARIVTTETAAPSAAPAINPETVSVEARRASLDSIRALQLVRSYRVRGHLRATLDPLGLKQPEHHPELEPSTYGFTEADYDRPIYVHGVVDREQITLRELIDLLQRTYCGNIGVEYMHIQDSEEKAWIQTRIEGGRNQTDFTERGKRAILERLTEAEGFEKFLDKRFTGTKRFGLEGAETLVPALEQILKRIRLRHGASRAAECARQRDRQAVRRDPLGIPGRFRQSR
jgi:2-oxoglutarate dehydrogenase E1 component